MKLRETLATNLKNIREKRNFSQRGMAEKIGISTKLYNELENATANPTLETLEKIAENLELNLEMLLLPEGSKFVYINSQNNTNNQEVKSGYFNDDSLMKVIDKLLKHNEKLFSEYRAQQ